MDGNTPILVGGAQLVQRDADPVEALDPIAMLERVSREAAEVAGGGAQLLADADTVAVVDIIAWGANNAPGLLAEKILASPAHELVTGIGGETPLVLVNELANRIAAGESRIAVVAGCNNLKTIRSAVKAGVELNWQTGGRGEPAMIGSRRLGNSEIETRYGLASPTSVYPIFENALRAHRGLDLEAHRVRLGALMSSFTEVAAKNPYAWFPTVRSAEELTTASARNRMIAFPYTKYLNAVLDTDQAAGVVMMSVDAARAHGIPEDRWIYWWGGAHAEERAWYASERPNFAESAALRAAAQSALGNAGIVIGDIELIDFYSCFPVAVEMACEMLVLDEADPRGLTLTGGLPYGGGPANNYTLHSLATALDRLRDGPQRRALVTGNGWYLTKHSATVLSSEPRSGDFEPAAEVDVSGEADPVGLREAADGAAVVETYTVLYGRDGAPERGIVIGRLDDDGTRFIANTPNDREDLEQFVAVENVGRSGKVQVRDDMNRFEPG
ncbi:MAG: acetyl-CoA acetyltransferase [Deltaproteobacteria bacterium]|nr:acetyl-CoA acetyltransferase [Deltaproteobacteria bacterium]MBW2667412.1 acetyl-CoA acetyltransferase [Deltaproteobacteria bacterium]